LPSIEPPSTTKAQKKRATSLWWKDKTNRTAVLRLCIDKQHIYGKPGISLASFWKRISVDYAALSQQPEHGTLARTVSTWIRERKEYLELLGTGEQPEESSYTDALDKWIEVEDRRKNDKQEVQERQGRADQETKESLEWRKRQFATLSQKDTVEDESDSEANLYGSDNDESWSSTPIRSKSQASSSTLSQRASSKRRRRAKDEEKEGDQLLLSTLARLTDHVVGQATPSNSEAKLRAEMEARQAVMEAKVNEVKVQVDRIEGGISEILKRLK